MTRKNNYACTKCKKTFSRKFNAERHNKIVHDEMAIVYDTESNWKSNIKKIDIATTYNTAKQTKKLLSSFTTSTLKSDKDIENQISNPTYNDNNLNDLYKNNLGLDSHENVDDQIVFKIIGKIFPLIESLDSLLLSRPIDNKNRIQFLSAILISSLSSSNPADFIKEQINYYRSLIAMKKAISLTAYHFNIEPKQARETLKGLVLSAPYSKNKFNN